MMEVAIQDNLEMVYDMEKVFGRGKIITKRISLGIRMKESMRMIRNVDKESLYGLQVINTMENSLMIYDME